MARFDGGWVKLWRTAWASDISHNHYLWALWTCLLSMANWKESKIAWNGTQRTLPPGSVVLGFKDLANQWRCSPNTIRKWIFYLRDSGRIRVESCTRGTLITICNWTEYQPKGEEAWKQGENHEETNRAQNGSDETLTKKFKKENNQQSNSSREDLRSSRESVSFYSSKFLEAYSRYPRKMGKKKAAEIYAATITSPKLHSQLLVAIDFFSQQMFIQNREEGYIPHFNNFMDTWDEWFENAMVEGFRS